MSQRESEKNVQDFLDELDDEPFIGNQFIGEDDNIDNFADDDDSANVNDEDDEEEGENRNPDAEPDEPDIGELQPRPRKYKFKNLDDVANVENFDDLPPQPKIDSRYVDSTGKFIMNLSTEKVLDARGGRESLNVIKHALGPRGEAKHVTTPFEAWNLFITPDILEKVVAYTNESIYTFRSKFSDDELKKFCAKNTYSKETNIVEIHAFLGLLYLRGVLWQNL